MRSLASSKTAVFDHKPLKLRARWKGKLQREVQHWLVSETAAFFSSPSRALKTVASLLLFLCKLEQSSPNCSEHIKQRYEVSLNGVAEKSSIKHTADVKHDLRTD